MPAPVRDDALQAQLLGPPVFAWRGTEVRPDSKKARALLGFLAARPQGASRDELAELLWSAGKLGNVRQALYELRKLPGSESWLAEQDGRVQVRCDSDLAALLAALEAGGEAEVPIPAARLLDGAAPGGAPAYDEWLEVERARLAMLLLEAVERQAVRHEQAGDFRSALSLTEWVLAHDPLNESAYQSAMRLCYLLGDPEAALSHYRSCRRVLRAELDTEPLDATRALADAIAAGDPLPVETSLEHLPERLQRLLQALALSGGELDAVVLARALQRDPFDLAEDLAELQRRRLLDERRLVPSHLLAEARSATPEPVRRLLHRRIAEALGGEQGDETGDRRLLAHHWLGAGERRRAAPLLLEDARWAVQRAERDAPARAFRALWVAERAADRFEAVMLLEGAAERLGNFALQRAALDEGDELAWELQEDDKLCLVRLKRARQLLRLGEVSSALEAAGEALDIAERIGDPSQIARAVNAVGGALYYAGRLDEAYDAFARNREAADGGERYRALNNLGAIAGIRGAYRDSYRHFSDALTLARRASNLDDIAATLNNLAGTAERMAAYEQAVKHLHESLRLVKRTGDPVLEVRLLVNLAVVYGRQGALGPSWNTAAEANEMAASLDDARLALQAIEHFGEIARLCGSYDEAAQHFSLALARYRELGDERKVLTLNSNLAVTRHQADPDAGREQARSAIAALDEAKLRNLALWFAAELALHARDPEQIRSWRARLDDPTARGNPHLALLADLADLRLALLEAAGRHRVIPPDDLEERLDASGVVEAPLGFVLLARACAHEPERSAALHEAAAALLAEQARGLPQRLRERRIAAPRRWLASFALDA